MARKGKSASELLGFFSLIRSSMGENDPLFYLRIVLSANDVENYSSHLANMIETNLRWGVSNTLK